MPEENEDKGFKVIDRRGVEDPPSPPPVEPPGSAASEGRPPGDTGVSPPSPQTPGGPPVGAPEGNLPPGERVEEGKGRAGRPSPRIAPPRFLDLVQSLQMGAMAGLGMMQGPDGKRSTVDLPAAKDAIDLLGMLQEKTKGNLTKEEEEVLREGLYHLRMGYTAMINAPPAGRGTGGEKS
jgi:hypothetical protein